MSRHVWEDERDDPLQRRRSPRSVCQKRFSSWSSNDTTNYLRKRERFYSRVVWKSQIPSYKLFLTWRRKETLHHGCLAVSILLPYLALYQKREDSVLGLPGDPNSYILVPFKRRKEGLVAELSGDLIFTHQYANHMRQRL